MPSLTEIAKQLESEGRLYNGFLLSEQERELVKQAFLYPDRIKLSKKEKLSQFSVLKDEFGNLYAVYNPSVLNPDQKDPIDKGTRGVIKAVQNLETGEWLALKNVDSPNPNAVENSPEVKEVQTERKFLEKQGLLKGYQARLKESKSKDRQYRHYILMDIVPGLPAVTRAEGWGANRKVKRSFVADVCKNLSIEEHMIFYHNLLIELQKLQQQGIVHRDLHGGNILVDPDDNFKVKIIDWGSAVEVDENGFWEGFHYTDPTGKYEGKIIFANGKDVFDILSDLGETLKYTALSKFTQVFGDEFDGIFKEAKDIFDNYKVVDLQPYIEKVQKLKEQYSAEKRSSVEQDDTVGNKKPKQ